MTLAVLAGCDSARFPSQVGVRVASEPFHVEGDTMAGPGGSQVQLRGIGRSGTEYSCLGGRSVFDGPDNEASVAAIASWDAQIVRLPLNEDCWLGINGLPAATAGAAYRHSIAAYVTRLRAAGIDVILDLHWSAPGKKSANGAEPMPDESHAPAFWASVGDAYANHLGVAFELYNEPYGVSWDCWQFGCELPAAKTWPAYRAVGMQKLLDIIRAVGAKNPVIVDGLGKASDFRGWSSHLLRDPVHQVIAGWHIYGPYRQTCTASCWASTVKRVRPDPVLVTELGQINCGSGFVDAAMDWLDAHHISYLAWAWDTWTSCGGPPLISSYSGVPKDAYGLSVKAHLTHQKTGS